MEWSEVISAKGKQLCSQQDIELYILVHSAGCSFLLLDHLTKNFDFAIDSKVSDFLDSRLTLTNSPKHPVRAFSRDF